MSFQFFLILVKFHKVFVPFQKARVQVWLYGRGTMRIEGVIIVSVCLFPLICLNSSLCVCVFQGFDEFMNLVMDDAVEVYMKKDFRRQIGWFEFKHLQ